MGSRKGWEMHGLTKIAQIWKPKVQKCTTDGEARYSSLRSLFCCTWLYLVSPSVTWAVQKGWEMHGLTKIAQIWKPKVQKCTTDRRGQIFIARSLFCCTWLYLVSPWVTWAVERGEKCTDWQKLHKYESLKSKNAQQTGEARYSSLAHCFAVHGYIWWTHGLHGHQKVVRNARVDKNCTNMKA